MFYNPQRVSQKEIINLAYEDLADVAWKNRVVIRSSSNMYNQSLVASLISNIGLERTEKWAKGLVENFARKPQGNDRSQIMAVANGEADLAVANSYYFGVMLSGSAGEQQQEAARKLGFSAKRTMMCAQQLYEGIDIGNGSVGLITYMRTDSINLSKDAITDIRSYIQKTYGNREIPDAPRVFKTKSKNAQEARGEPPMSSQPFLPPSHASRNILQPLYASGKLA